MKGPSTAALRTDESAAQRHPAAAHAPPPGTPRIGRRVEPREIEEALSPAERVRRHLEAADRLARRPGRRSALELAEIARHLRHEGPSRRSFAAHREAARACLSTGRLEAAAESLAWLGGQARDLPPARRLQVRLDWSKALSRLGRPREAALRLREGWRDPALRNEPGRRAMLAGGLAALANAAGDHRSALRWTGAAGVNGTTRATRGAQWRLGIQRVAALWGLGRVDEAAREVRETLRSASEAPSEIRLALWSLAGTIAFGRKELDEAAAAFHEAVRLGERLRQRRAVAVLSSNLGMIEGRRGRSVLAERLLRRAFRLMGDSRGEPAWTTTRIELGRLRCVSGDLRSARSALEEALSATQASADARAAFGAGLNLGAVARCEGRFREAGKLLGEARALAASGRRRHEVAVADANLAWIAVERADPRMARCLLARAHANFRRVRDPEGLAFCARIEALLAESLGDVRGMRRAVEEGRMIAARAKIDLLDRQLALLGAITRPLPAQRDQALSDLRLARQVFAAEGYHPGLLEAIRREGQVFLASGDSTRAKNRFQEVRRRAKREGYLAEAIRARIGEALATRRAKGRARLLEAARQEAAQLSGALLLRKEIAAARRWSDAPRITVPGESPSLACATPVALSEGRSRHSRSMSDLARRAEAGRVRPAPSLPSPAPTRAGDRHPARAPFRYRLPSAAAGLDHVEAFQGMAGGGPGMRSLFRDLERLKTYGGPVLIEGETGTGKELLAAAVHRLGPRSEGPYIPVACAAIPAALLESEFFGMTEGAFTGATANRPGLWVQADRGDLLLDDLQDLPLEQQTKLLRVIETGEVRPVGATSTRRVDARVIATVNRPIDLLVEEGRIRKALYYRLGAVVLRVPPLRERPSDLGALAVHLLRRSAGRARRPEPAIEPGAFEPLAAHPWPGNVRELEGFLERVRLTAGRSPIDARVVSAELEAHRLTPAAPQGLSPPTRLADAIAGVREWMIRRALSAARGSIPRAATALGITRQALHRHLRSSKFRPAVETIWINPVNHA